MNQGTLSRARKLLCLKIVVAFHATIKKSKKKKNFWEFKLFNDRERQTENRTSLVATKPFKCVFEGSIEFYYHMNKNSEIFPVVKSAEYAKILAQRQKEAKEMRRKKSLPSVNPGILSRARTLLCLKIVVAFHATIKGKRKNFWEFKSFNDREWQTELHWLQLNLLNVFSKEQGISLLNVSFTLTDR